MVYIGLNGALSKHMSKPSSSALTCVFLCLKSFTNFGMKICTAEEFSRYTKKTTNTIKNSLSKYQLQALNQTLLQEKISQFLYDYKTLRIVSPKLKHKKEAESKRKLLNT